MEVVHERCCGLDVHKEVVVARALTSDIVGSDGQPKAVLRRFGTMTEDLLALAAWLAERGVAQVAMEGTGVYRRPVWNILEEAGGLELLPVNAHHTKAVPGRKADSKDAPWLAELPRRGLVRGSSVPDWAQREPRELTR